LPIVQFVSADTISAGYPPFNGPPRMSAIGT
jgi:hypothetical protein